MNGAYQRHPAHLPCFGREVPLDLRVRRFRCLNEVCPRRTFAAPLRGLVARHARSTRQLVEAQGGIGVAAGGEGGSRLLGRLGMPTSAETVRRRVHHLPLPRREPPRRLGVNDWAILKGRTYGTILVDLDAGRPVDLLPDRRADTLAAWLRAHPGVEVVTRDRSTEYSRGIIEGAPEATQVTDRWHLLLNTRQMLER